MPSAGPPTGWTLPFADLGSSSSVGSVRFEVSAESSDMGAWSTTSFASWPSCACPEFEGTVAAAASALSSAPLRILFQDLRPTAPVARSPVARVLASPKGTRSAVHAAEAAREPRAVGRSVLAEHRHPDTLQRPTPPAASRPRRTPYASACRAPRKNGKGARSDSALGFRSRGCRTRGLYTPARGKSCPGGQTARFKCARAANGPVKSPAHVLTRKYAGGGRA